MKKFVFLGNFAWSYSVYRNLKIDFQLNFEINEIWVAKIQNYQNSPFLLRKSSFKSVDIKVMGREDLSDPNKYKNVDLFITCGFPYKVPVQHIDNGKTIAINLHPSLLPKYWGPDPIRNQILKNDTEFGVSLQILGKDFDSGLVLLQSSNICSWALVFTKFYLS